MERLIAAIVPGACGVTVWMTRPIPMAFGSWPASTAPACTWSRAARKLAGWRPTRTYTPSATRPAMRSVRGPPAAIQTGTGRGWRRAAGRGAPDVDRLARQEPAGERRGLSEVSDACRVQVERPDRRVAGAENQRRPSLRHLVDRGDRPGERGRVAGHWVVDERSQPDGGRDPGGQGEHDVHVPHAERPGRLEGPPVPERLGSGDAGGVSVERRPVPPVETERGCRNGHGRRVYPAPEGVTRRLPL